MSESINRISVPFDIECNDQKGIIAGYASVFHVLDQHKDQVTPGAFHASLRSWEAKGAYPKMLWQHNHQEPIGVWDFIDEDSRGLYAEGRLNLQTQRGREALALLSQGALDGLSIGVRVLEAQKSTSPGVRMLTKLDLVEVSVVTFPANQQALVTSVKEL
ncbi:MAG: HK97 family phage prohead protease [Alphaproteobacteria bacterium]